jgi:putative addiction module component (TIGR02574 family)
LQVTDYIDFLLQKHTLSAVNPIEITREEKEELERRLDDFEANPSAAVSLDSVMNKMLANYGL